MAERGLGIVLGAPFEVLLPRGITNPVQPDILYFRTGNGPESGDPSFAGVPDLIVEVLSPSTRRRDEGIKKSPYEDAGVLEYWLVDSRPRTVLVYTFVEGRYAELGRFGGGEAVRSVVLSDLHLRVGDLFSPLRHR